MIYISKAVFKSSFKEHIRYRNQNRKYTLDKKRLNRNLNLLKDFLSTNHWLQHKFAINDKGIEVDANSSDAVSWCLVGACQKIFKNTYIDSDEILFIIGLVCGDMQINPWNDQAGRSKDDILDVINYSIKLTQTI